MDKARIFDIYRGTTHDGPGMRSTVFFQSCPLSCQWCHNPEGMRTNPRIWWNSTACIGCMLCHEACPSGANQPDENGIRIDPERCTGCGACVRACPSGAMTFISREWTLDALLDEVLRDKPYYQRTHGGVTASGGECMLQHEFITLFFSALHHEGIDTALDTCGFAPWQAFEAVLPHTDHVLYDLKLADCKQHLQLTGQPNTLILENAEKIADSIKAGTYPCDLWIRTPLIPGATATPENLRAIGTFIAEKMKGTVSRWELCAFNNSCITKYDRLGKKWHYRDVPLLTAGEAETLRKAALSCQMPENRIVVTGLLSEQ